jgi:colanic acid biosynthesis protein WcaH
METVDEYIDDELFTAFLDSMPQVCVEVVLVHDGGVLVAKRANRPVEDEWFWPGSRLYKGERLETAARRVGRQELGIEVAVDRMLGVQEHFWDESAPSEDVSRHTVNVVFRVEPTAADPEITLDDQHTDYAFISEPGPEHHEMVRRYFEDYDLAT